MTASAPAFAGIYTRISHDDELEGKGVARQLQDCLELAEEKGWVVADDSYRDNDVSANRKKARPQFQRLLGDIRSGRINSVVIWDADRLTRQPRETEDILDLAEQTGLRLAAVGGDFNLESPRGRRDLRNAVNHAKYETDQSSRRIKRKILEKAETGEPHGRIAFGYDRVPNPNGRPNRNGVIPRVEVINAAQAAVIREAAALLLGGMSLRSAVALLNEKGAPTPPPPRKALLTADLDSEEDEKNNTPAPGCKWSSITLRQMLLRPRNAGLRQYRGKVIGRAAWEPIYDEDTHDRVVALLTDPSRRTNKGTARRHLLSGIARCSRPGCGGRMIVNGAPNRAGAYVCQVCTRIRRKQEDVDRVVETFMIAKLSEPDALAELAIGDQDRARARAALDKAAAIQAKLERAADDFTDDLITREQFQRMTSTLRARLKALQVEISAGTPVPGLVDLVGPDAEIRWNAAPLDVKRSVLDALVDVVILPSGSRGGVFDPTAVKVMWKTRRSGPSVLVG